MLSGILVPALHHVRKYHDKGVLHVVYGLILALDILHIIQVIFRHLGKRKIEVLGFITGLDIDLVKELYRVMKRLFTVLCENRCRISHGIQRKDHLILNKEQAHSKNKCKDSKEQ